MEITDLIIGVVVSAVWLLVLMINGYSDQAWSAPHEPCRRLRGTIAAMSIRGRAAEATRNEQRVWLVLPGGSIVDRVPAEAHAGASDVRDLLVDLDEWFTNGQRHSADSA